MVIERLFLVFKSVIYEQDILYKEKLDTLLADTLYNSKYIYI